MRLFAKAKDLLSKAKNILQTLEANGHEAFVVGGCVRDMLLNRPVHDVDICTAAHPQEVIRLFERVIPTGLKHGTVTVLVDNQPFEVTTYRRDGVYTDHRRPHHVRYVRLLKDDLIRRDFTMNAMAMDKDDQIVDYFQGLEDLKRRVIRTVGAPAERFQEDALRMLRAIRFGAQLGFRLEDQVERHIQASAELLERISMERITAEFEKTMAAPFVDTGLLAYAQNGIARKVAPFSAVEQSFVEIGHYPLYPLSVVERWALFLSLATEEEAGVFLKQLRLTKAFARQVRTLLSYIRHYAAITHLEQLTTYEMFDIGESTLASVLKINLVKQHGQIDPARLTALHRTFRALPLQSKQDLRVNGKDLLDIYTKKPGPWIQQTLRKLQKAVLDGHVENDRDQLLAYLMERDSDEC